MEGRRRGEGCRSHVERTKCSFVVGLHTRRTLLIARFVMQMPCRPSQPPSAALLPPPPPPLSLFCLRQDISLSLSLSLFFRSSLACPGPLKDYLLPFSFPLPSHAILSPSIRRKFLPLFDPYLGARESFKPPSGPTFRYLMETWKLAFHRWNNKF